MSAKKASIPVLFFRKIARQFERLFFIAKTMLPERQFLYLACVVVAFTCAVAVIILKSFAHYVFVFATYINGFLKFPFINVLLPIVGILLTVFVIRNFLGGSLEKGSSRILFAVAKKGGILPKKQMYAQIVTSSLTVGLGGSAGLESPITITGAAIGSNFAQKYRLSQKDRILLLACGVAAGIGAAFNAPVAGVLFSIEVVLTDVTISAFVPIIISAATGALVSTVVLNEEVLLSFRQKQEFDYHNIPFYILLGLCAGFISLYHAKNFQRVEGFFARMKNKAYKRALLGATMLGILIFFFPLLFGEGYESIKTLANGDPSTLLENTLLEKHRHNEWILLSFLGITMMFKAFATGMTLGSGGNGGNFAPSLFVGSYLGFFVAKFFNLLGITHQLPVGNFTIVGMAGILSGLFHAPLTAIFLIGEITGGYDLMVPLMIVSSISFAVSKQFEKHSMDVKHLAEKDDVFTSDKDRNILLSIDMLKLVDHEVQWLRQTDSVETLIQLLSETKQEVFPVLDEKANLTGIVELNAIRPIIFNSFRQKYTALHDIVSYPQAIITLEEGVASAMEKFESTHASILPVLKNGRYFGLLEKTKVLEAYRLQLKQLVIE
ncbi:chloride channel protein [Flavobacterium silvaticum]|uniref:Chloride channel protein n=1 Tax=Flavobacterium silvaticum TaxID=1852020 RepID=A0A972FWA8_9FLAO|nr:chloride channel protein [Flavobacterium silvaticum]NMH28820.1 chloride channel protein [Flavobacterium silvaticum]